MILYYISKTTAISHYKFKDMVLSCPPVIFQFQVFAFRFEYCPLGYYFLSKYTLCFEKALE